MQRYNVPYPQLSKQNAAKFVRDGPGTFSVSHENRLPAHIDITTVSAPFATLRLHKIVQQFYELFRPFSMHCTHRQMLETGGCPHN